MGRTAVKAVFVVMFLVLVFLLETETSAQLYDQSYALVIGIDKYQSPKWKTLTYAVKDAQGMAEFLMQQGFQVTSLYNQQADRNTIIYQMQNVFAPRVKKGDRVLVFFAGHGNTERFGSDDYGYIIPHDATNSSHTYISMEELQTLSRKMGQAKHQLFIMDACYGGLLGVRSGAISEHVANYLDEITKRRARQILTAGGPNQQVVDGGPGGHSVFTGYLLKGLREGAADLNGDGYVTFAELTSYLVPAATNTYQTPGYSALPGHELGEFVFRTLRRAIQPPKSGEVTDKAVRGPISVEPTPVELTPPKQLARLEPERHKRGEEIGPYIKYDDGTVLDTRTKLMWMTKDFRVIEGEFLKNASWYEAIEWAKKMNKQQYAGYNNWRFPSIKEYRTIRDKSLYQKVFESADEYAFWSKNEPNKYVASYISFRDGWAVSGAKEAPAGSKEKAEHTFSVRLVRDE